MFWTPGFVAKPPNTLALRLYLEQSLRAESCLLDLHPQKIHQKKKQTNKHNSQGLCVFHFFPSGYSPHTITNSIDMNLSKLQEKVKGRERWNAAVHGVVNSHTQLSDWTTKVNMNQMWTVHWKFEALKGLENQTSVSIMQVVLSRE